MLTKNNDVDLFVKLLNGIKNPRTRRENKIKPMSAKTSLFCLYAGDKIDHTNNRGKYNFGRYH